MKVLDVKDTRLVGVNKRYVSRRYVLTPEYRNQLEFWKAEVWHNMLRNKWTMLIRPVGIRILISTYKDADSIIKPALDALTGYVIQDDSQVERILVEKTKIKKGGLESIEVWVE